VQNGLDDVRLTLQASPPKEAEIGRLNGVSGNYTLGLVWQAVVSGNLANPANPCPIYCGGAATYSRPRTIILPNEDGDYKIFF
jgi:hypothetical protein